MARSLYLHIGSGKTGTTAIQHCMETARAALLAEGILYPPSDTLRMNSAPENESGNGTGLLLYLIPEWRKEGFSEDDFKAVFSKLLQQPQQTLVISNEMLEFANVYKLADIVALCQSQNTRLQIVYVLRDIIPHAWSSWKHNVLNHGRNEDWPLFQKLYLGRLFGFKDRLTALEKIVGRENMTLLSYSGDIASQFLKAVGSRLSCVAETLNPSASYLAAALMLAYNRRLSHIGWNPENGALTQPFRDALFQNVALADEHELIPMTEHQRRFFELCCAGRLTDLNGLLHAECDPLTLGDPTRLSDITLPAIAFEGIAKGAAEIVTKGLMAKPPDRDQIALDLTSLIRSSLS